MFSFSEIKIPSINSGVWPPHSSPPTHILLVNFCLPPSSLTSHAFLISIFLLSMELAAGDKPNKVDIELGVQPKPADGKAEEETVDVVEVEVDFSKRAQWLRAAVLGANDGLLSTASLMMGVGAVRTDAKSMILTGIAGLIAGACSMGIGEFVSVYSQYDIELAQINRETRSGTTRPEEVAEMKRKLPSPWQAAAASALAFAVGALVPLLAALFIKNYRVRLGAVVAAVTVALFGFGWLSSTLGKAPVVKSSLRVLVGGWVAMAITFGFTKLVGSSVN